MTLYFGSDLSDADVLKMFQQWTDDANGPMQANASFGECETNPTNPITGGPLSTLPLPVMEGLGNNLQPQAEDVLKQAAMEGKTLFSSTGDTGSSCPVVAAPIIGAGNGILNQVVPLTNYPASSQYATAVGGTVLYTDGAGNRTAGVRLDLHRRRLVAADRPAGLPAGRGQQQHPVPAADPGRRLPGGARRGRADPVTSLTNGYQIYSAGAATEGGGTSLSSPLWMGMWARVQGAKGGAGNGFANYPLYATGKNATTVRPRLHRHHPRHRTGSTPPAPAGTTPPAGARRRSPGSSATSPASARSPEPNGSSLAVLVCVCLVRGG